MAAFGLSINRSSTHLLRPFWGFVLPAVHTLVHSEPLVHNPGYIVPTHLYR